MKLNNNNTKRSILKAQFNSLEINEQDPTLLKGTVIIHDFEESSNGQVITEEVCAENMNTLIGKRIVCKYIPSEDNNGEDALTNHEESESKDRDGNEMVITNTIAIGFIENVYIDDYTDNDGNSKRVLFGDVVIWNDEKYANITGLIQEWLSRDIQVHMSVEYLYCNYNVVEGVEYLQTPIIYVAHTLLNSEQRGEYAEVLPAYDCASLISLNEKKQWNKAINQLNTKNRQTNNNKKGENNMPNKKMFKKICELSHDDIRSGIYNCLKSIQSDEEYYDSWITECYDTYFILSDWSNDEHKYWKITYTKTDDTVTIDYDNKKEVTLYTEWKEIPEAQELITSLNTKISTLEGDKKSVEAKLTEATNKITSLNSKVEELQPIAEQHNKEQYEKTLNEKQTYYENKFKAVNAMEKFNSEEIQDLIKQTAEDDEKAVSSLNSIITDLLEPINNNKQKENNQKQIKEMSSQRENLIPNNSFEDRYLE